MSGPAWLPWAGAVGITLIVATARIFRPLRRALKLSGSRGGRWLGALLSCSMCLGFWVGLLTGLLLDYDPAGVLWTGGAVSLFSYAADVALLRLGEGVEDGEDPDLA